MSLLNKLKEKKQKMQAQMDRGRKVTEQMKADKQRKKLRKAMDRKPGATKAISDGLVLKKSPLEVMKDEYSRRKYERKQKNK